MQTTPNQPSAPCLLPNLAREHTGEATDINEMIDAGDWFAALRRSA